jgi:anti-sigma B factor antagonist
VHEGSAAPDEAFSVFVSGSPQRPVVHVAGELDAYTAPRLRDELVEVAGAEPEEVVLDLTHLTFTDSTGLGVIVGALKQQRARGGDLSIRGARPGIRKVLEITGVARVLTTDRWSLPQTPSPL